MIQEIEIFLRIFEKKLKILKKIVFNFIGSK